MKYESKIKHSRRSKKRRIHKNTLWIVILAWILLPSVSQAQMFSVEEERGNLDIPLAELYVGLEPVDLTYEGSATGPRAGIFAFEGPLLRVGYRSQMLDLSFRTGGQITGIDDVAFFDFGGHVDVGIPLYMSRPLSLLIPIRIDSRFTNITNSLSLERFRFGSLTLGAGAKVMARPASMFRLEAGVVPSYGFSFASGGVFGGSMGSVAADGRLYFDRLFNEFGLSVGYTYDIRNFDVDENIYDYRINAHSVQVGITF